MKLMTGSGTMPYRQREILLVPIPFSDLTSRKVRPVVVLSNDVYNRGGPDLLVAGITSNVSSRPYTVGLDTPQLEQGAIRHPSMVRADKIFSIDQAIILKSIGIVRQTTFEQIRQQVRDLIGDARLDEDAQNL